MRQIDCVKSAFSAGYDRHFLCKKDLHSQRLPSLLGAVTTTPTLKNTTMTDTIIPTNLGATATLHVEAIINGRQIGVAIVNGNLIQCSNKTWSTQQPRPGMSVEQAANGIAEMLLARGGVKFV